MTSIMADRPPSRLSTHAEAIATHPPAPSIATRSPGADPAKYNKSSDIPRVDTRYADRPASEQARRPRLPPIYPSPRLLHGKTGNSPDHHHTHQFSHPAHPASHLTPPDARAAQSQHLSQAHPKRRSPMVPVSRYVPYSDRRPVPPGPHRPIHRPSPPVKNTHIPPRAELAFPPRPQEVEKTISHSAEAESGGYQLSKGAQRDDRWRSRQREREAEFREAERERARYEYEAYYRERSQYPSRMNYQRGQYDYGPDYSYPYRGQYPSRPLRRSPFSPPLHPQGYMERHDRRASLASVTSTVRHNSAVLYPEASGIGPDMRDLLPPRAEGAEKEALVAEQERAMAAARKALTEEKKRKGKLGIKDTIPQIELPSGEMSEEDKVRRRRVQVQVFVHARPTYCRWGQCRAVLNSWALLEKHILHAHIKPLAHTLSVDTPNSTHDGSTPKGKKADIHCHWAECSKIYADKERMYRHCLVEHMGEFCARCPFNCLFEGPTFPSLMAHISRRHPKATPNDFVPGLIHFEPHQLTPGPLPATASLKPITMHTPSGRPLYTPIVPPFTGQPAGSSHRQRLTKVVAAGCIGRYADNSGIKRDKKDGRVVGKIIGEVVRLSVQAARERRALMTPAKSGSTGVSLGEESAPTERKIAGGICIDIDVKTIAKQVKAAIKLESDPGRSMTPSGVSMRSDSQEVAGRAQTRALSDGEAVGDDQGSHDAPRPGTHGTLPVSLTLDPTQITPTAESRATWDILVGAKTVDDFSQKPEIQEEKIERRGVEITSPSPSPSQTASSPASPSSSPSEFKIQLKRPRPTSPISAGLKRDLRTEEAEEVARRLRPRRQRR